MMTKQRLLLSTLALTGGVLALGLGPDAGAAEAERSRHLFGMVGVAAGQSVRLNVVNTLPPGPIRDELPPGPIRARLALLDGDGRLLAVSVADVPAGRSTFLDLDFDRLGTDARRLAVRAVVDVLLPPGPVADPAQSTLEIVDNETARTVVFVSPGSIRGFNPQPDPPRE